MALPSEHSINEVKLRDYHHFISKMSSNKKLILVLGATGAQGIAVIDKLLAPSEDGLPSPYVVRALTRDPHGKRAVELSEKGVECVKGNLIPIPFTLQI